jgi:hypothetical protein
VREFFMVSLSKCAGLMPLLIGTYCAATFRNLCDDFAKSVRVLVRGKRKWLAPFRCEPLHEYSIARLAKRNQFLAGLLSQHHCGLTSNTYFASCD